MAATKLKTIEAKTSAAQSVAVPNLIVAGMEISEFLDETVVENADEMTKVMAASCTTCECSCSVSS